MGSGASAPDPFDLREYNFGWGVQRATGASPRSQVWNPAQRKLFLISAGQSLATSNIPTFYAPSASVDQFNLYDGGSYDFPAGKPLLGCQDGSSLPGGGPGNALPRLAQAFIDNNKFDKVVHAGCAVGSTTAAMWADPTNAISRRLPVLIRRALDRGVTPGSNGWTMAITWWQGEHDNAGGTSSASYQASMAAIKTSIVAAGFVGKFFVNIETWLAGVQSATIQAAQDAVITNDPTFFKRGGNLDTLNNTYRTDTTHLNDAGAIQAVALTYNAMVTGLGI